jgi:methylthioribulose-1-phosphate dehydratase
MNTQQLKQQLAETIRQYNSKGWSPATSTNYSFKDEQGMIWVSRSGIDKSQFHADDFMTVDELGRAIGEFEGIRPSAETLIHCVLYELFPETKVILHSHSVYPVLMSAIHDQSLKFEGYEVQKGFEGVTTHESSVVIPVFDNTQDMSLFRELLRESKGRILHPAFVMRKHGTYAWGRNLFEAKRHLETLEYLCQCEWMLNNNLGS